MFTLVPPLDELPPDWFADATAQRNHLIRSLQRKYSIEVSRVELEMIEAHMLPAFCGWELYDGEIRPCNKVKVLSLATGVALGHQP